MHQKEIHSSKQMCFCIWFLIFTIPKYKLQYFYQNNIVLFADLSRYLVFVARVTLAAIDHNMHLFRPQATTKDGHQKFARKYSKLTKKWHAEPVKIPKDYKYMPYLLSQILSCRYSDKMSVKRRVPRPTSHPKNLAPTMAMK